MKKKKTEPAERAKADPEFNKLGNILVREGLLTFDGLQRALKYQQDLEEYKPLGKICVELKLLSKQDLKRVLREYHKALHLGEILINMNLISQEQLEDVLRKQQVSNTRFGLILVRSKIITENQLVDALSLQLDLPRIVPAAELVDSLLLEGLAESYFREHCFIPLQKADNQVVVVMADPLDDILIRELTAHYQCRVTPAIATTAEITNTIGRLFDAPTARRNDLNMGSELLALMDQPHISKEKVGPIAQFLLRSAVEAGATALHIESQERYLRVRYRIDGILQHKTDLPLRLSEALIECLRTPFYVKRKEFWQEKIVTTIAQTRVQLSVSTFESEWGENLSLYLLYPASGLLGLDDLNCSPMTMLKLMAVLSRAGGLVMTASPIRNGKSSLLYAFVNHLNQMDRSILALEQTIEQRIPGVLQRQHQHDEEDSYAELIEAMSEFDSDILMLNALPDSESARAAHRAVLFGKKVLTAMTAQNTMTALFQLQQMGGHSLLLSPVPVTFIAQRLVRQLCISCRTPYMPAPEEFLQLGLQPASSANYEFYRAVGCEVCEHEGYKGMTALHEWLELSGDIRKLLREELPLSLIQQKAMRSGRMVSLMEDGIYKVSEGLTSLEELKRTVQGYAVDNNSPRSLEDIHDICHGKRLEFV